MPFARRDLIREALAARAAGSAELGARPPLPPMVLSATVSVLEFGATGDGETDDTQAIEAAIEAAEQHGLDLVLPRLRKRGDWTGYKTTAGLHVPPGISVYMGAPIVYYGSSGVALRVGAPDNQFGKVKLTLSVVNRFLNWENDTTGIELINLHNCSIAIDESRRFRRGVVLQGIGHGNAHNTYLLGDLSENQYCLSLLSIDGGWVNENLFLHGFFQHYSDTEPGKPRFGVYMHAGDHGFNNNVFMKPSFQLGHSVGPAMAISIENGHCNSFLSARFENAGTVVAEISGPSEDNVIESYIWGVELRDRSRSSGNTLRFVKGAQKTGVKASFDSGNLVDTVDPFDDKRWHSSLLKIGVGASWDLRVHEGLSATGHHLRLSRSGTIIPAVYLELGTGSCKRFVLHRIGQPRHLGRVLLALFDAGGNRLGGADATLVHSGIYAAFRYRKDRGGIYVEDAETNLETVVIKVAEEVVMVWLAVQPGTSDLLINRFVVESAGIGALEVVTSRVPPLILRPPTEPAKAYARGTVLWNADQERGSPKGWICTGDGAPGNWSPLFL